MLTHGGSVSMRSCRRH